MSTQPVQPVDASLCMQLSRPIRVACTKCHPVLTQPIGLRCIKPEELPSDFDRTCEAGQEFVWSLNTFRKNVPKPLANSFVFVLTLVLVLLYEVVVPGMNRR